MKKRFASVKHTDHRCNGCATKPIVGIRFKCDTCPNYNLCLTCVEQQRITLQHEINHPLILVDKYSLPKIDMSDIKRSAIIGEGGFGKIEIFFFLNFK
jgi:hypothetical protein